jgi:DNA-binding PucR family transcriptional regulator
VRLAQELVDRVEQALGLAVLVGLGTTVSHLGQLARSRREADQVLHVLRTQLRDRRIAAFDDVRPHAFLLELQNMASVREHIDHGKVAALRAHDAAHGSQYIETLRAYLECLGDVSLASRNVHVHPNTLRYRLRRLSELIDLDLDDPVERLVVELHLRLL